MAQGLSPYLMANPPEENNLTPTLAQLMAQMAASGTQANIPQEPQMPTTPMPPAQAVAHVQNQLASRLPAPLPVKPAIPQKTIEMAKNSDWEMNTKKALAEQDAGVAGLEKMMQEFQASPRGINFSPLAAYIDSIVPNSKLAPAAQAMAPMNEDQRQEKMIKLQDLIQQRKQNLSQNALAPYKAQLDMYKDLLKNEVTAQRLGVLGSVRQDNQTMQAVDRVVKDKILVDYTNRLNGAERITSQLQAVREGKMVDTNQFLNDINTEYVNLLTNSNNAALGKQERTEYRTVAGNIAAAMQQVSAHPESINSPEILAQIEAGIKDLTETYRQSVDRRADILKREFVHNPEAQRQMEQKIEEFKHEYGTTGQAPAVVPERKVWQGVTYEKQGNTWVAQ